MSNKKRQPRRIALTIAHIQIQFTPYRHSLAVASIFYRYKKDVKNEIKDNSIVADPRHICKKFFSASRDERCVKISIQKDLIDESVKNSYTNVQFDSIIKYQVFAR